MRQAGSSKDLLYRHAGNPQLSIEDVGFQCSDVRNAGVVNFGGERLLLLSIEHLSGMQAIHLARGGGREGWQVESEALITFCGEADSCQLGSGGVMDPRVTLLSDRYYICYTTFGEHGFRFAIDITDDFKTVESLGAVSEPDTKAGTLFPEKIGGRFAALSRPGEGRSIWLSFSDDLKYWGSMDQIASPRGGFWDCDGIGPGSTPIRIDEGWLMIYYGVKRTSAGPIYRLGAMILDAQDPRKVIGRTNVPILSPREMYERVGDLTNIVFSCGAILEDDNQLTVYYGAADSCICSASASIAAIVERCRQSGEIF